MSKGKLYILVGMAAAIGLAGFFVWNSQIFSPEYRAQRELERKYIQAMTEDTYGGKTSEETLSLFISALKAGDVELASKYFMLDANLSREKWLKTLVVFKEKGLLDEMAEDVNSSSVKMELNKYSNIWKIVDFN